MNWLHVILGLLMLASLLAGAGWLFWRALKASDDPGRLIFHVGVTTVILAVGFFGIGRVAGDGSPEGKIAGVLAGAVLGIVLGVLWAPRMGALVGDWFGNLYTGGGEPPVPTPVYSAAEAHWQASRYPEAFREIRAQLERFPQDMTGLTLLARLQAEHLDDLPGAEATLERILAQPGHTAGQQVAALNLLADLQLKVAQDPDAARASLERIAALFPDSPYALQAAQRLAHLGQPGAAETVRRRGPIPLRRGATDLGLQQGPVTLAAPGETAEETVARLVRQLEAHPLDTEAREQLAILYAEEFGRLDLATDQFEQLLAAPHTAMRDVARWFNALADAQVRHGREYEAVRATLQRLIDRFPGLAPAEVAQRRIEHLRLELKGREQGRTIRMGTYERDLGLKNGPWPGGSNPA